MIYGKFDQRLKKVLEELQFANSSEKEIAELTRLYQIARENCSLNTLNSIRDLLQARVTKNIESAAMYGRALLALENVSNEKT